MDEIAELLPMMMACRKRLGAAKRGVFEFCFGKRHFCFGRISYLLILENDLNLRVFLRDFEIREADV